MKIRMKCTITQSTDRVGLIGTLWDK